MIMRDFTRVLIASLFLIFVISPAFGQKPTVENLGDTLRRWYANQQSGRVFVGVIETKTSDDTIDAYYQVQDLSNDRINCKASFSQMDSGHWYLVSTTDPVYAMIPMTIFFRVE